MFTLPDVWIRPNFGGKGRKMTGQLEAHANGFRYSTPKNESLDIMYRCAAALPCDCRPSAQVGPSAPTMSGVCLHRKPGHHVQVHGCLMSVAQRSRHLVGAKAGRKSLVPAQLFRHQTDPVST